MSKLEGSVHLTRHCVDVISQEEFSKKLLKSAQEKKPLRIKAGFDPSAPDIHLGHTVLLRTLRLFQDAGHQVVFIIGDYTARIGDPSGRSKVRPSLTLDEVKKNSETYLDQAAKILDTHKNKLEIRKNSEWFEKMSLSEFMALCSKNTVARILERDDFRKRFKANEPLSITEILYPIMQGYDSVVVEADVELGGTDQVFNLLVGRDMLKEYGREPQVVMTLPLLVGLDGVQKMSKSLNNHIAVTDSADEMFGKVMSIRDELMPKYYELLLDETMPTDGHPMENKKELARKIVLCYHSLQAAERAKQKFEEIFSKRETPSDIPIFRHQITGRDATLYSLLDQGLTFSNIASKSQFRQKVKEGAVEVNGRKISDIYYPLETNKEYTVRVGRELRRLIIQPSK